MNKLQEALGFDTKAVVVPRHRTWNICFYSGYVGRNQFDDWEF